MTYTALASQLQTIFENLTDFAVVYDYEPDELGGYPAVTITAQGHQQQFRTTASNDRTIQFLVRLYCLTPNGRDSQAETSMRSLLDLVITTIDANPTLNGACDFATPTNARIVPGEREVQTLVAEVEINARALVRRTP